MAAYNCYKCRTNWPVEAVESNERRCPDCGGSVARVASEPDVIPTPAGTQRTDPYAHRLERYMGLGFSLQDAELLANAKDRLGLPVYWGHVARALSFPGCDHALALRIFA